MSKTMIETRTVELEKILYRPKEAALIAGVSTSWIYARISDGSLPAVRLAGRMVRIRKNDLLTFIEDTIR